MPTLHEPRLPSVADIEVARTAVAQLRDMQLGDGQTSVQLRAVEDGTEAIVNLPKAALDLLVDMLSQLADARALGEEELEAIEAPSSEEEMEVRGGGAVEGRWCA